jgi:hypothetical protein
MSNTVHLSASTWEKGVLDATAHTTCLDGGLFGNDDRSGSQFNYVRVTTDVLVSRACKCVLYVSLKNDAKDSIFNYQAVLFPHQSSTHETQYPLVSPL